MRLVTVGELVRQELDQLLDVLPQRVVDGLRGREDLEELLERVGAFEPRKIEISAEPIEEAVRGLLGEWFPDEGDFGEFRMG